MKKFLLISLFTAIQSSSLIAADHDAWSAYSLMTNIQKPLAERTGAWTLVTQMSPYSFYAFLQIYNQRHPRVEKPDAFNQALALHIKDHIFQLLSSPKVNERLHWAGELNFRGSDESLGVFMNIGNPNNTSPAYIDFSNPYVDFRDRILKLAYAGLESEYAARLEEASSSQTLHDLDDFLGRLLFSMSRGFHTHHGVPVPGEYPFEASVAAGLAITEGDPSHVLTYRNTGFDSEGFWRGARIALRSNLDFFSKNPRVFATQLYSLMRNLESLLKRSPVLGETAGAEAFMQDLIQILPGLKKNGDRAIHDTIEVPLQLEDFIKRVQPRIGSQGLPDFPAICRIALEAVSTSPTPAAP